MSAAHTEERLIVKDTWLIPENHSARKIGGSTNKERDFNDYAHIVCTVNGRHRNNAADARRLAACWNAFDGVPTDKIEGKSAAEYVANESYLTGLVPIAGRGMEMGLSGDACQLLAESFAGQFKGSGGVNFIEVQMHHKDMGPFTVTIQRQHGETPAQQKAAALKELDAARTLLSDALETFDENPHQDHEIADRIRAFLKGGA